MTTFKETNKTNMNSSKKICYFYRFPFKGLQLSTKNNFFFLSIKAEMNKLFWYLVHREVIIKGFDKKYSGILPIFSLIINDMIV